MCTVLSSADPLCFSLSRAPQVFTVISSWAHSRRIHLLGYLNDWLILAFSKVQLKYDLERLLTLCQELGIVVNRDKSKLVPVQQITYLGMLIDSVATRAFPTEGRIDKFRDLANSFLSGCSRSSYMASSFGTYVSPKETCPSRLYSHEIT